MIVCLLLGFWSSLVLFYSGVDKIKNMLEWICYIIIEYLRVKLEDLLKMMCFFEYV